MYIVQFPLPFNQSPFEFLVRDKFITKVDAVDADVSAMRLTYCRVNGSNTHVYILASIGGKPIGIHRVIMARVIGRDLQSDEVVDHIDGNSLNNCRDNLRVCTQSENLKNRKIGCNNKCGYKGVRYVKHRNKWRSTIQSNKQIINLGCFDTAEEAYSAYCEAAKKYHGEFARLK